MPPFTHRLIQNHAHRMDASQILKHPFITDDSAPANAQPSKILGASGTCQSEKSERITDICEPFLDPPCQATARDQNANNRLRPLSTLAMHLNHFDRRQVILGDISNMDMKKSNLRNRSLPVRRVFSDLVSFKAPYFIAEEKPTNSDSTLNSDVSLTKEKSVLLSEVLPVRHNILLPHQNSIPLDERPPLPIKPLKNPNKIHSILPSVSHARHNRNYLFLSV